MHAPAVQYAAIIYCCKCFKNLIYLTLVVTRSYHTIRSRHLKRFGIISLTLHNVFTLSHNALPLLKSVIAFIIYRSGHIGAIITSYSYCYKLSVSIIVSIHYRFSIITCLLLTSPSSLCKEIEGDLKSF
jgi:hypothetical protein